jgi:hypothetical protein
VRCHQIEHVEPEQPKTYQRQQHHGLGGIHRAKYPDTILEAQARGWPGHSLRTLTLRPLAKESDQVQGDQTVSKPLALAPLSVKAGSGGRILES